MAPVVWEGGHPISRSAVEDVERDLGIKLPNSYLEIVLEHDGGVPSPSYVPVSNTFNGEVEYLPVNNLVPLVPVSRFGISVVGMGGADDHVAGTVEFALDAGGYFLAFDYREQPDSNDPPIVVVHRDNPPECAVLPLAGSFLEFLSLFVVAPPPPSP